MRRIKESKDSSLSSYISDFWNEVGDYLKDNLYNRILKYRGQQSKDFQLESIKVQSGMGVYVKMDFYDARKDLFENFTFTYQYSFSGGDGQASGSIGKKSKYYDVASTDFKPEDILYMAIDMYEKL